MTTQKSKIIWTKVYEAPALATYSLLPIVQAFTSAAGVSVELSADHKVKRAMETANKLNARYALILGENEIAAGVYALKDMAAGEQRNVSKSELLSAFIA